METKNEFQKIADAVNAAYETLDKKVNALGNELIIGYDHAKIQAQKSIITHAIDVFNEALPIYCSLFKVKPSIGVVNHLVKVFLDSPDTEPVFKLEWLSANKESLFKGIQFDLKFLVPGYDYPKDVLEEIQKLDALADKHGDNPYKNLNEHWDEKKQELIFTEEFEKELYSKYSITADDRAIHHIKALYLLADVINELSDSDPSYRAHYFPDMPNMVFTCIKANGTKLEFDINKFIGSPRYSNEIENHNIQYLRANEAGLPVVTIDGVEYQFNAPRFTGLKAYDLGVDERTVVVVSSLNLPQNRGLLFRSVALFISQGLSSTIFGPVDPSVNNRKF